jgi:hypothetical protein
LERTLDVTFLAGYSTHPRTRTLLRAMVIAGIPLIILVAIPEAFVILAHSTSHDERSTLTHEYGQH